MLRHLVLESKSLVRRVLGIPDPWKQFRDFERRIRPETWAAQPAALEWLARTTPPPSDRPVLAPNSPDPVVRRFADLWGGLEREFAGKYAGRSDLRVLIHLPPVGLAAAAYSLFQNLARGLSFLGVPVAFWEHWGTGTALGPVLDEFRPSVLLSIDHRWFGASPPVGTDSVRAVRDYRRGRRLAMGLTCPYFPTGAGEIRVRAEAARTAGADFFYSFQTDAFIRQKYRAFVDLGFRILSLEFGANPLVFYPVDGVPRDLDFVYLASCNAEKWPREVAYLSRVFHEHTGLILGPGWPRSAAQWVRPDDLRLLYARAKVGVNLHVPFQIDDPTELNERAYNLAASGTPQLMDNPALLPERLGADAVYSAADPDEYHRLFRRMLADPDEARGRAVLALERVLVRDTVFHRADRLVGFVDDFAGACS
jgi:hypothetical protein